MTWFCLFQSRQAGLQRKNEQLEMEVMQARLWQSSMDGEVDDEDGDSKSIVYLFLIMLL
jgi:hypothetical protein